MGLSKAQAFACEKHAGQSGGCGLRLTLVERVLIQLLRQLSLDLCDVHEFLPAWTDHVGSFLQAVEFLALLKRKAAPLVNFGGRAPELWQNRLVL
jgi:hypothetical protein